MEQTITCPVCGAVYKVGDRIMVWNWLCHQHGWHKITSIEGNRVVIQIEVSVDDLECLYDHSCRDVDPDDVADFYERMTEGI